MEDGPHDEIVKDRFHLSPRLPVFPGHRENPV